jgi:hypothetical protein
VGCIGRDARCRYLPDQGRANVTTNSADLMCIWVPFRRCKAHAGELYGMAPRPRYWRQAGDAASAVIRRYGWATGSGQCAVTSTPQLAAACWGYGRSLQACCASLVKRYLLHGQGSPLRLVDGLPPGFEVDTASRREAPAYERASYLSHLVVYCAKLCKERWPTRPARGRCASMSKVNHRYAFRVNTDG